MTDWLLAIVAGVLAALLQYGLRTRGSLPLVALRAAAVTLVAALLLDAPAGARVVPASEVALDASASWMRAAGGCNAWPAALDSAARLGGGHWLRFGDSVRADVGRGVPVDGASHLQPVADRATATGRPMTIVTDGELDEPAALAGMPAGSRLIVMPCAPAPDLAVVALDAPRSAMAGDTVAVRVTLAAGGAGARAVRVSLLLDEAVLASTDIAATARFSERVWEPRVIPRGSPRGGVVRVVIAPGDAEPRNDTLAVPLDVSSTPSAVLVSTAPDFDAREAAAALRGATSRATRVYYRVAPGSWRLDGALTPVREGDVRAAVRESPLVVLHGDTALFGAPRAATRGSLLLFAPPAGDDGEWFAEAPRGGESPIATVASVMPFDSLPPISVSSRIPRGEWAGLASHRGGVAEDRRNALVGWETPRRIAVLGASGLWRWRFRGGIRADAYGALMGAIYDWLGASRPDRRLVLSPDGVVREGEPVRWQRGSSPDSVVTLSLTRRGDSASARTVTVRFPGGPRTSESASLARGVYDVRVRGVAGAPVVLAVNASRELLPRRATLRSATIAGTASAGAAPSARSRWWIYALSILLLSLEWILRRRRGLR